MNGEVSIHEKNVIGGELQISIDMIDSIKINDSAGFIFSSGRCALYSIFSDIEHTFENREGWKIILPDYLCDSITRVVLDTNWEYEFYHVNMDFSIDVASLENITGFYGGVVLVIINYFGMVDHSENIQLIKGKCPKIIVIEDNVQSFFEKEKDCVDYSFTSLRKWFPCPDGGAVKKYSDKAMYLTELKENKWAQYKFAGNVLKSVSEYIGDSIALKLIEKGEKKLDEEYLSICSSVSKKIFEGLNLEMVCKKRKENAAHLHAALNEMGITHIYREDSIPLFVPILIEDRDLLRRKFFEKNIFVPRHWCYINKALNGSNPIYDMELSLICDQRYGTEDMGRQIEVLKDWIKERGE